MNSVTWMRERDLHILTADVFTYSADERFKVLHFDNSNDWTLEIRFAALSDDGLYECQVNSDPKISRKVFLKVKENSQLDDPGMFAETTDIRKSQLDDPEMVAETTDISTLIEGPRERYIQAGESLTLTCIVRHPHRQAPSNLVWLMESSILDYDSPRGGVSVKTEKLEKKTVSKLGVAAVTPRDSGQYTCSPSNFNPYSLAVYVQNGQHHAAVYHSGINDSTRIEISTLFLSYFLGLLVFFISFAGG